MGLLPSVQSLCELCERGVGFQTSTHTMATMEAAVKRLQDVQGVLGTLQESQRKLAEQKSENVLCLSEMKLVEADANIFKLVGTVLVKQDKEESQGNVQKRLDYI